MSSSAPISRQPPAAFNERLLLITLAAVQFTTILDFLIIMPLGPQYARVLGTTPSQFGVIVSAYAISAGICGVAAGFLLDRFDRKSALLWLYSGFTVATFICAIAPSYPLLAVARAVTGAFGGVAGALILAIIGDVVPDERRGAAMGMVMSSFSLASIGGVPLGLALAARFSWHAPFFALTGLCAIVLALAARALPSLRGHMEHAGDQHPAARMLSVVTHGGHQLAFLFMAVLTCMGFLIFPYLSNYLVANVGLTESQLPLVYLAGGLCTLFSMNWIGRWADRAGKRRVFIIMALWATIPIVTLTNLGRVSVVWAIATSTLLMICMSGRMVPAMALMTGSIEPRYRGGFMSVNSSVQQFSSGLAAYLSGQIMGQSATGEITRFPLVGLFSVGCALVCIYLSRFLNSTPRREPVGGVLAMESEASRL